MTTTVLYLSLSLHTRNRIYQSTLIHQQALILNNVVEPQPPPPAPPSREVRAGLWESAKDGWNGELERNIKKLYATDWHAVRDQMEEGVSRVWRRAFKKTREVVPDPPKSA